MIEYYPEYIEDSDTVAGYIDAVRASLQYWLDVHTDATAWASQWLMDCDVDYIWKQNDGTIENDYFSFDWTEAALKYQGDEWQQCAECGSISHVYDDQWCECEDPDFEDVATEDLVWFLRDIGAAPDNHSLERALLKDGFEAYRQALEPITSGIESEVKEILDRFAAAGSQYDLLLAALAGTNVWHVHGNIISDYGDHLGLDYCQVDSIRNDGLESWFDEEDIQSFLEE